MTIDDLAGAARDAGVPVYMRVGDGSEQEIGRLHTPTALPDLLRQVADHAEHLAGRGDDTTSKET